MSIGTSSETDTAASADARRARSVTANSLSASVCDKPEYWVVRTLTSSARRLLASHRLDTTASLRAAADRSAASWRSQLIAVSSAVVSACPTPACSKVVRVALRIVLSFIPCVRSASPCRTHLALKSSPSMVGGGAGSQGQVPSPGFSTLGSSPNAVPDSALSASEP